MQKWIQVTEDGTTWRLKVPKGWIVRYSDDVIHKHSTQGRVSGWDWRSSIAFVPDYGWHWIVE